MNKLFTRLLNFLLSAVKYYQNGTLYTLIKDETGYMLTETTSRNTTLFIMIVSRENYNESLNSYPITDKSSLLKFLKIDPNNRYSFYDIANIDEGQSWVNFWEFKAGLPKSFIILPETLLLGMSIDTGEVFEKSDGKTVFITNTSNGINSGFKSKLIDSAQRFCLSSGLSFEASKAISAQQVPQYLLRGMRVLNFSRFFTFFNIKNVQPKRATLKHLVLPPVIIISLYIMVSSAFLIVQEQMSAEEFQDLKGDMNLALDIQNQYQELIREESLLSQFVSGQSGKANIWLILGEVINETKINTVRFNNGRYTIIGETEKATSLLQKISSLAGIRDAKFDQPIRKGKRSENYNISFFLEISSAEKNGLLN